MSINRSGKKLIVVVLASAAVGAATQVGAQAGGAHPGPRTVSANAESRGYPNAVPPILRPARPSELVEIRRAQTRERKALFYRLAPSAGYSIAEMGAFASRGYGGI